MCNLLYKKGQTDAFITSYSSPYSSPYSIGTMQKPELNGKFGFKSKQNIGVLYNFKNSNKGFGAGKDTFGANLEAPADGGKKGGMFGNMSGGPMGAIANAGISAFSSFTRGAATAKMAQSDADAYIRQTKRRKLGL